MEGGRKHKIVLSIFIVLVLGIGGVILTILNAPKEEKVEDVVLGQTDIATIPYITSLPPVVGYVGVEYVYDIKYSDSDSDSKDIVISLEGAPEWLSIEDRHIYGIPPVGSSGQYKFNVRISDGTNSSVQENYILIQDNETE